MRKFRHWLRATILIGPLLFVAVRKLVRLVTLLENLMTVAEKLSAFTTAVEASIAKIVVDVETLTQLGRNGLSDAELAAFEAKSTEVLGKLQALDDLTPDPVVVP